ncbi:MULTISPECIES: hypothetical protein, partial [unclassified Oceanispirochaeta]|uniref:hypothetical protein n=1 Tax=unclassified Oceanispirochaeta TaxID=2635722 RepID=UPI000E1860BD
MTEVLSQEEIDQLLTAISTGDKKRGKFIRTFQKLGERVSASFGVENKDLFFKSLDRFQAAHVTVDKSNIQEIQNNVSLMEPEAIFKLGSIEFIPVHFCPHCKKYHYAKEISDSYQNDIPTPEFAKLHKKDGIFRMKRKWLTENRTIRCSNCNKRFQPTIVISN